MPFGIEKAALMGSGAGAGTDYTPTKNHCVGGYSNAGYNLLNQVYTTSTNAWLAATAYAEGGWQGIFQHPECWDGVNMISYQIGARKRESSSNATTGTSKKYTDSTNAWTGITAISGGRQGPYTGFIDEKVYIASGHNSSAITTDTNEYDPAGNSYTSKATATLGRQFGQGFNMVTAGGGVLYMVGGNLAAGVVTANNEKFTVSTNTWAAIAASTSYERRFAGMTGIGDYIHVVSGHSGGSNSFQTAHRSYDQSANSWTSKQAYGTGIQNMWLYGTNKSGTPYGYLRGGSISGTDNSTTSQEYSNLSNTWSSKSAVSTGVRWDP